MTHGDTIVAIATPPGRGGIGLVRLSGPRAIAAAQANLRYARPRLEAQRATLGELIDPASGKTLDQVMVTLFRAPHSYTGEDVAEVACHGAPVILNYLVQLCLRQGARVAEPGEFTLRAFLNGRIDLTQAEAVRDLIAARTLFQAQVAARQMEGALSGRLKPVKKELLELIAGLEAGIDFGEDDVPVPANAELAERARKIRERLGELAATFESGRVVHDGLTLAMVGRPNVGKSSLFNRLLNEERAIVTAAPGTTRDWLAETANLEGIPIRLVDTAGIREAAGEVERIGIEKSMRAIADASLRLLVLDLSRPLTEEDVELFRKAAGLGPLVCALNKADLETRWDEQELRARLGLNGPGNPNGGAADAMAYNTRVEWVRTSAVTNAGVEELRGRILGLALPGRDAALEGGMITDLRHRQLVEQSLAGLDKALAAVLRETPHEMVLLDLYDALRPLDELTGQTSVEDVLGVIFSTFCVGK